MSASLLTHAASNLLMIAFFYLLVTEWPLVENHAQSRSRFILAGVCGGYVFGMRPLTALVMVAPPLLFVVLDSRNDSNRTFRRLVTLMVGAVLGALPALADNYLITGNPLRFMYSFARGRWSLVDGLMNTDSMLASLLPTLFGWGWKWPPSWLFLSLPLGLAAVPFLMGKANRWDWLLMATSVSLPVAYAAHSYVGGHGFGARFYYESYFCLFFLAARGFYFLTYPDKDSVARLVATGMFVVLSVWSASTMIDRLHLYRGYNDVTNSLTRAIETAGIQKAIVLLGNNNWRDWNSAGNLLQGSFDDNLIIASNTSDNSSLLRAYPDRAVYLWLGGKLIRQK